MNRSNYDNFLYQLIIEDHPDPIFDDLPAVDPRGEIHDKQKLLRLAADVHRFGVQHRKWSTKATLYMANVVIGAAELADTKISVQHYFTGLASLLHKHIYQDPVGKCIVVDTFNPPVESLLEMAELI
ncbi:hypothetical protein LRP52_43945 [Photobacterium sp. ZSDE20]|uniref:Uncharacterized protein n=1 Tax=Photobacterium pectinilyticum TaxID=2906793 RepID=A0ABT1NA67_9GAMM|nr:hypothetical protein [Photobacterium sp. ZSDE20]MCQ1061032.1 hypothetical protein [Photobacterium sp. ZSDE20]MDD1829124.1 hypothetical protein [Photobacterium sp. ZSDE20]